MTTKIRTAAEAARFGHPSYVWQAGQERRLQLVRQWVNLENAHVLVDGCGIGMYMRAFHRFTPHVYGIDIDPPIVQQAAQALPLLSVAAGEHLPFPDDSFDFVFSHEVIEHVQNDHWTAAEMVRVLRPGGRIVIFCPNRLYPFETHGHFWRGKYHFGNTPLINWLPNPLRNRLAPHVRVYTASGLRRLFADLPVRVLHHAQVFPGYDKVVARRPRLGRWLRQTTYFLERTPLRCFGISHFLVLEKNPAGPAAHHRE